MEKYISQVRAWQWCIVLLAAVAATWLCARDFPGGNNVYHLPLVLDYAGTAEGPHDAYHESMQNFTSYFWSGVAAVVDETNIRPVFLLLLFAGSLLTTFGGFALARAGRGAPGIAALGIGFVAFAFGSRDILEFGGGELFSGFVTHSQFATAVMLFAAALAVRERWLWSAVVCGVAADLNLFLGAWGIVNLILARLMAEWAGPRRLPWLHGILMSALWLAACAPTLVWALGTVDNAASDTFSFVDFIYDTFPYHSFVHMESWTFLAFMALSVATCVTIACLAQSAREQLMGMLIATAAGTLVIACAIVYVSDDRMVQNLYPLRYAAVAHWMTAAAVVAAWSWLERDGADDARYGALAALGFALGSPSVSVLGLMLMAPSQARRNFADLAMLLALAITLVMPALSEGRVTYPSSPAIGGIPSFLIVCLVGAGVVASARTRTGADRWLAVLLLWLVAGCTLVGRPAIALPLAAAVTALAAIVTRISSPPRVVALVLCGVAMAWLAVQSLLGGGFDRTLLIALAGMVGITFVLPRLQALRTGQRLDAVPVFASALVLLIALGLLRSVQLRFDFPRNPRNEHWAQAQVWARENTPPDTYFYAPDRPGFATLSRRPLWWEDNAFAAVMWKPSFHAEWSQRKARALQAHGLPGLIALAHEAGIPYLALERRLYELDGAPGIVSRYCNDDFCVVQVEGVTSAPIARPPRS